MAKAYLGIGTNLGNRLEKMRFATKQLAKEAGAIVAKSSIYETAPWGFMSDKFFFNAVIEIETSLDAHALLDICLEIEHRAGRKRIGTLHEYANRPLDIDILFFGDKQLITDTLVIPQAKMEKRRFVLEPLCEIAADFIHPVFKKPIKDLLNDCEDNSCVTKTNDWW